VRNVQQLRDALPVVGLWANIDSSLTAEAAALAGADYVVVDEQHGVVDPTAMAAMLQAIQLGGAAPLVRVARNDPWVIGHALDLGALGVIVPMVEDAAQAAAALAACRYAPAGVRSVGVVRGEREPEPLCLVMIETRAGLERLEEIAATPGLDGIYIGPSDLALSLGLEPTPQLEHPPVLEAIERIRARCAAGGLTCGLHCLDPADVARFSGQGFGLLTAGGDLAHLRAALAAALAVARSGA
jgi:4-hydroxy-2-oxoheptanedioate aldolase